MDSRFQVTFCLLVAVAGLVQGRPGFLHTGILGYTVVPVSATSQYHTQDVLGQYSYGYTDGLTAKSEVKTLDGVTRGGYTYVDANGVLQSASYTADAAHGFRVSATNLPVAPEVPAAPDTPAVAAPEEPAPAPVAPADAPVPVEDTPEVAAAKVAHKAAYDAAAAAAAAAPETPTVVHLPAGFAYSTFGVPVYTPHFSKVVTKLHLLG